MDDERLKNGGSVLTVEYFDHLLEQIREIRLSERRFYQKITDIYATALDYDRTAKTTKQFFAKVQNKMDGYDWSMLMLVPTSDHYAQMCLRVADNGIGMSKEFRNSSHPLAKKIPILAMTANAFSEDVQNAFNAGMNAHIVKPVDMKVLIKTVRNLQTGAGAAGTLN